MSDVNFLTNRTKQWNDRSPPAPPKWTLQDDNFDLEIEGDEDAVPLEYKSSLGDGVHKMKCKETQEMVAVKKLQTSNNSNTEAQLKQEVQILRALNHYHCIRVLGSYKNDDWFGIVTQPVAQCDLKLYLSARDSLRVKAVERDYGPPATFLPRIMGCLAYTLHYIHEDPHIRHRDIKPENILLDGKRVLFADFGLSKLYTATQSGSSGTSRKTLMYTSPERANNLHRNRTDDIFSLGCVFADIYTVYKGRTYSEFLQKRREADSSGHFHRTVPAVIKWLEELATERCDVQIVRLLRDMLDIPQRRPKAEKVWKVLTTCTAGNDTYFCGPCCMPHVQKDPVLTNNPETDPSNAQYTSESPMTAVPASTGKLFKDRYPEDQQLDLRWIRNLQHWDHAILDVVEAGTHPHLLAHKRLQASQNSDLDASIYARNEAEILRQVQHRHIVQLYGTYLQGNIYGLLYEPAADRDLRSYMELVEVRKQRKEISSNGKEFGFLTRSFGCLATALAQLHQKGYDHNDIRPENILVHEMGQKPRIFLSKFSFGGGSSASGMIRRFFDRSPLNGTEPKAKNEKNRTGIYRAPEQEATSVRNPESDVFALGCVFLEMGTVLCERKVREFEDYRINQDGDIAYCKTLQKSLEWLSQLKMKDIHEIVEIIENMMDRDPERRHTALEISENLRKCKNSSGVLFAGDCTTS